VGATSESTVVGVSDGSIASVAGGALGDAAQDAITMAAMPSDPKETNFLVRDIEYP